MKGVKKMAEFSFPGSLYDLEQGYAMGFGESVLRNIMQLLSLIPLIDIEGR